MKRLFVALAAALFIIAVPVRAQFNQTAPVPGVSAIGSPTVVQVQPPAADFSIGTWIADLLGTLVAVFGSVIATFLTKWVMALAKKAGVEASQAMSDRLDAIIENGLHAGALETGKQLTGKLNVEVKDKVIADAVTYAQTNASNLIAGMANPATKEELQARAAKVLSNIGPEKVLTTATATVSTTGTAADMKVDPPATAIAPNGHPTGQALP
jgi:hypothetical protein